MLKQVFFGRPALWGLALDGQAGVEKVLGIMKNELDVAMAIAGMIILLSRILYI